MFDNGSGRNKHFLERTCHRCFLLSFGSFGQVVSRGEDFFKSANQKQELPMAAMFVNGSEISNRYIEDLPRMHPTKFRFIWQSGFRGEDFSEINQSETRIVCGGHVCYRIGTKWAIFIEDLPRMLPTKFRFIWPSRFRGEDFLEINQSETRIACGDHVC